MGRWHENQDDFTGSVDWEHAEQRAANIQLAATLPNFLILESLKQWDGFHATLLKKKVEWQDGNVIPSKEPGLGVELDEAV